MDRMTSSLAFSTLNDSARKLLLSCLTGKGADRILEGAEYTEEDWDAVLALALKQGLAPLLYHRLKHSSPAFKISDHTLETLRAAYSTTALENTELFQGLNRILTALREMDIQVVVLKGAYLAQAIYKNVGLRPMVDIDLLVRAADLSTAHACMLELGYQGDARNCSEHAVSCSHYAYFRPDSRVSVEIHWNIEGYPSPFLVDIEGLWERSQPTLIAGVQVRTLSKEDLLLHLCLHTSFHHLFSVSGVRSLCDITETLRCLDELDWEQFQSRCREWHATRSVFLTLYLAKELLGANLPDEVLQALEPINFDSRFAAWAEGRIFASVESVGPESDHWGQLQASGRPLDKLNVLLKTCFPPPRRLMTTYSIPSGSYRVLMYYPIHLKDLLSRHSQRVWSLMHHDEKTLAWLEGEARRVEETAVKKQVLGGDDRTRLWIEQESRRVRELEMVKWLASDD